MAENQMPPVAPAVAVTPPATAPPVTSADRPASYMSRLFSGRINRLSYLLGPMVLNIVYYAFIFLFMQGLAVSGLPKMTTEAVGVIVYIIAMIIVSIFEFSFSVRRAHDLGKKWTYLLWSLVPLVNLYIALVLLFRGGEKQENKYGPMTKPGINLGELYRLN